MEGIIFEERERRREEGISEFADANGNEIRDIISMLNEAVSEFIDQKGWISGSLQIFISAILEEKEKVPFVAEVLLEKNQLDIYPGPVIK